jgi:acetolactate synthase-1/2/3 large subunit
MIDTGSSEPVSRPGVPAGEAIARILIAAGVRRAYTVPGESFLEVLDAAEFSDDITLISTRHESGASFMAEADAKMTGIPAVAAATRAVGASNLAIGVHTAMQDATPMIVLLGQVETWFLGKEAFQEVDLPNFYDQITKWSATIQHTERIPDLVAQAVLRSTSGRPGPVMLALPADVLRGSVPAEDVDAAIRAVSVRRPAPVPTADVIRTLADRVRDAKAPVVIAGAHAQAARDDLIEFAEVFGVGIYSAFRRQDVFPNDHPNYLGHLTLGTAASCLRCLEDADLVVVLGARLDEITTQSFRLPLRSAEVIHVDLDPAVPGAAMHADWAVTADVRALLKGLLDIDDRISARDWTAGHQAYLAASTPARRPATNGVDPAAVLEAMREYLPADSIITNDAGNFSVYLHAYWRFTAPHSQLAPSSGAMGYGIPAGVGAALADTKGRTVVAVAGDGGFLMSGQEIETAVRYGLNMIVIVFRNGMYGTIAMHQLKSLGRVAGITIGDVDLATFARSLGALGVTVEREEQLAGAFTAALQHPGVSVIDVHVDAELTTPTKRLSTLVPNLQAQTDSTTVIEFDIARSKS